MVKKARLMLSLLLKKQGNARGRVNLRIQYKYSSRISLLFPVLLFFFFSLDVMLFLLAFSICNTSARQQDWTWVFMTSSGIFWNDSIKSPINRAAAMPYIPKDGQVCSIKFPTATVRIMISSNTKLVWILTCQTKWDENAQMAFCLMSYQYKWADRVCFTSYSETCFQ